MLNKLKDNIFYMPNRDETDRPILGLICGKKYSLVIDSGISPNHAREFLDEVNLMNVPPVKYLVLTHHHYDHVLGIKEINAITISHEKTKEEIEKMKDMKWDDESLNEYVRKGTFSEFSVECIKAENLEREKLIIGDVDITYKDSMKIDLGGLTCILISIGGSHTDDSTAIYIPQEKTMFLGDCIYGCKRNGLYGYNKEKLFEMINNIKKYDVEQYIISHEALYDKKKISDFWNQLEIAAKIAGEDIESENAVSRFLNEFNRKPLEDEEFYINCFVNMNKANLIK